MPPAPPEDPRVRFAAERTLLAWVRTGLGLMGFGFAVARFGGGSPAFGVALLLLGVSVNVLAGLEYRTVLARIDRAEPYRPPRWSLGLLLAGVLSAVGVAMAGFLLAA